MNVFVTGASGQLGCDVCRVLASRGIRYEGTTRQQLDLLDSSACYDAIVAKAPDAVIHCAAYTAVDRAEDEPALAYQVNAEATRAIARACRTCGAKLVYLSTDYVFPGTGDRFYQTDDAVAPLNVYGKTKRLGEEAVQAELERYFIVRISWVFGANGNNFVKTMLRLAQTHDALRVVSDQIGSPTYTADLAPLLCDMIATDRFGVYHATNEGVCSWAAFAQTIFRLSGLSVTVTPIPSCAYPTRAQRPLNSRLSKESLDRGGFARLPAWQDALMRFLRASYGISGGDCIET